VGTAPGAAAGVWSGASPGAAPEAVPVAVPGVPSLRDQPAEGSFPLFIVVAHGAFAVSTVILVVLTALGVGAS